MIAAQRESVDKSEIYNRALDRLSPRDLDLLLRNTHRFKDPDCPKHLLAVWNRFGALFKEEAEKQASLDRDPPERQLEPKQSVRRKK